jgi:hypothetical protein
LLRADAGTAGGFCADCPFCENRGRMSAVFVQIWAHCGKREKTSVNIHKYREERIEAFVKKLYNFCKYILLLTVGEFGEL